MGNALLTVGGIKKGVGFARSSRSSLCLTDVTPHWGSSWTDGEFYVETGETSSCLNPIHTYTSSSPRCTSEGLCRGADHLQKVP